MTIIVEREMEYWMNCETPTGHFVLIGKEKLPEDVKEGYVLTYDNGRWMIDAPWQDRRKQHVKVLMDNLFVE